MDSLYALFLFILVSSAISAAPHPFEVGQLQPDGAPDVKTLLNEPVVGDFPRSGKYKSPFFRTLTAMAKSQRLDEHVFFRYNSDRPGSAQNSWAVLTDGFAVELRVEKKNYVLVILSSRVFSTSDISLQQLVLLNKNGQYLDHMACGINSRYGVINTNVLKKAEWDSARLVVRFNPHSGNKSAFHNQHIITFGGKGYIFRASERDPQPTEWTTRGLCRIAIRDGKFAVVFPKLAESDGERLKPKTGK